MHIGDAPDFFNFGFGGNRRVNNVFNRGTDICYRRDGCTRRVIPDTQREDCFWPKAFDGTTRQPALVVGLDRFEITCDQLKLDSRTAAVENQDVHWPRFTSRDMADIIAFLTSAHEAAGRWQPARFDNPR